MFIGLLFWRYSVDLLILLLLMFLWLILLLSLLLLLLLLSSSSLTSFSFLHFYESFSYITDSSSNHAPILRCCKIFLTIVAVFGSIAFCTFMCICGYTPILVKFCRNFFNVMPFIHIIIRIIVIVSWSHIVFILITNGVYFLIFPCSFY